MTRFVSPELFSEVARVLSAAPSWVIFSHKKPDGDAVGSATALFEAGVTQNRRVRWMGPDPIPHFLEFLPHVEEYVVQDSCVFEGRDDLHVFLDSANEDRGVRGLKERAPDAVILNIDHHEDNSRFGTINCVEPGASSVAELLWHIMTAGGWSIAARVAECLYTGIVADTGGFMFSNTTPETHRVAADLLNRGANPSRVDTCLRQTRSLEGMHLWGAGLSRICRFGPEDQVAMSWLTRGDFEATNAVASDTDSLVGQLLLIRGVRFAVLITEGEHEARASFRSKEGALPAALVARAFGGGGHPRAAGATLPLPLEAVLRNVRAALEDACAGWTVAD
ncbi:MAG: bifunctional oligoribonuclease/PAP phosphatase NrnA [Synergistaceae bacterium]|jgi:phosphoesterase RecJ-like protein|nr:bifunctional oligoribonuclease/PAP phosphatase NrnA [Synergistaceae bacterium]